jgi:alpha-glucosidase
MLLTLRGTPFLYYGEEIGMRNVPIAVEAMQDPLARTLHPNLCRDGERTPMCWDATPAAGFSSAATTWLPVGPQPAGTDVASQRDDRSSLLWLYKELLALRRAHPVLHRGAQRAIEAPQGVLAFERHGAGAVARVALNFGAAPVRVDLGAGAVAGGLRSCADAPLPTTCRDVELGPDEGVVLLVG